jgi:hypothetical protein
VLTLAYAGVLLVVHAMLIKQFSITAALDVAGRLIIFFVLYGFTLIQFVISYAFLRYRKRLALFWFLVLVCIAWLFSASLFLGGPLSALKLLLSNPIAWATNEGFVLLLSAIFAWITVVAAGASHNLALKSFASLTRTRASHAPLS